MQEVFTAFIEDMKVFVGRDVFFFEKSQCCIDPMNIQYRFGQVHKENQYQGSFVTIKLRKVSLWKLGRSFVRYNYWLTCTKDVYFLCRLGGDNSGHTRHLTRWIMITRTYSRKIFILSYNNSSRKIVAFEYEQSKKLLICLNPVFVNCQPLLFNVTQHYLAIT